MAITDSVTSTQNTYTIAAITDAANAGYTCTATIEDAVSSESASVNVNVVGKYNVQMTVDYNLIN